MSDAPLNLQWELLRIAEGRGSEQTEFSLSQVARAALDRLELSYCTRGDGERIPCPPDFPDGIECRNSTIDLLEARVEELKRALSDGSPSWIDVAEHLPDDEQKVLAGYFGSSTDGGMESLTYYAADAPDSREHWLNAGDEDADTPSHWMPLPEPPK